MKLKKDQRIKWLGCYYVEQTGTIESIEKTYFDKGIYLISIKNDNRLGTFYIYSNNLSIELLDQCLKYKEEIKKNERKKIK